LIGTVLDGRYKVLRKLGVGGMGEVYLGEHLLLQRKEAIKVLKSRLAGDASHLARFRREARATNRVQHANIVSFYDFGRLPDGRLYLTMEFADGPNLEQVLKVEERIPADRAARMLACMARAIGYAHSKGVIHRDLKPDNIIVISPGSPEETLKILDFGVAKITAPGYMESLAISREGEVFGTPAYVSPEQIRGVRDDSRIDIYAMGCIGYELVTGETPFVGRPMAVLEAHMDQIPIPPSQRRSDVLIPGELDELIMRCLEKDPDKRPQTGEELATLLDQIALPSLPFIAVSPSARPGSFGGEDTVEGLPQGIISPDETTTGVYAKRAEQAYNEATLKIGEAMCDLGYTDPDLLVCLAQLHQLTQDIALSESTLMELARREAAIVQQSREREASLRFALAELNFDHKTDPGGSKSVKEIMERLEARLSGLKEQTDAELASLTEQQITQTAEKAHMLDESAELYGRLHTIVEAQLPSMGHHQAIAELITERAKIKRS
jgi:serine/threonine protein kinase